MKSNSRVRKSLCVSGIGILAAIGLLGFGSGSHAGLPAAPLESPGFELIADYDTPVAPGMLVPDGPVLPTDEQRLAASGEVPPDVPLEPKMLSVLVYMDPMAKRGSLARSNLKALAREGGGYVHYEYKVAMPNVLNLRDIPETDLEALKNMPGVTRVEEDVYHPNVVRLHDSTPLIRGLQSQIAAAGLSADGTGIRICVVDTGIDMDHMMYSSRIDAAASYDFHNNDPNPDDDHGHGSHVSGIALGGTGISWDPCSTGSIPFQGVAPGATLIGAKVLNASGGGLDSNIIAGIDHCADQSPSGGRADVINMSIGSGNYAGICTHSWAVAANNAAANGVVAIAASGNENNSNSMGSPACGVDVIAVGMTWKADYPTCEDPTTNWNWGVCTDTAPQTDDVGCFSNESDFLDVTAPGANIWSASNAAGGASIAGSSGTSMSSPQVAGLAALVLGVDPTLTPAEVRQIIRDGAIDMGPAGFDRAYGWGRIDVIDTLNLLTPCIGDPDCDDGLWCNGSETCSAGSCVAGSDPCPGQSCDEATDTCVAAPTLQYEWNMNTNPGWTTQGLWAWGQPTGGGGLNGGPDPSSGATGTNVFGYNLSGDYENNLAELHLTTGAIDCSNLAEVSVEFQRWLGVEQPLYDHAYFRISTNGSTWTTLWENGAEVAETAWNQQSFDISAIADGQPTVYLRWTMGTTDGSWQYCGWNIDDVEIWGRGTGGGCTGDPDCDDGLWCNGAETCVASACQSGTAPNCNDGVGCTDDSCNEGTDSCNNIANNGNCDNGQYCDGAETCHATLDCQSGIAPNCNDGVGCTDDSCNEGTDSCDNVANNANCDNGQYCDGAETCHATLDCQSGSAPNCNDSVGCTDDSCNEGTDSCDNVANNAKCDDGLACNGAETCDSVLDCQSGTPVNCNDGVSCTTDACTEPGGTCSNTPNNAACDNGLFCDGAETCSATLDCQVGTDPCPGQICDEATDTCNDCITNGDCDDGLFCNGAETCVGGTCQAGTAVNCNDGVVCTDDSCNEGTDVCDNIANNANCDNGLFCDGAETCSATLGCQAGTAVNCDDGVGCTDDSCNEATDSCDNVANNANCPDDGLFCNGTESCDAVLDCVSSGDPCPGGSVCNETTDTCDGGGCVDDGDCNDGSACTVDTCVGNVCFNDCAGSVSSFPYSEDFEAGLGAWSNVGGDVFDWTRDSVGTPSSNTGPSGDHTTGSGFYMYIETSSPRVQGDTAIFEGPCLDLTAVSTVDLTFWYHMFGANIGTLNVEVSNDCSTWSNVWTLSGDQGNTWFQANVNLDAFAGSVVRTRFVGIRGASWNGDIAIDDISVDAAGTPCSGDPECNDADACTTDACVSNLCQNTPINCDDGNGCTTDSCSGGVCSSTCPAIVSSFPDTEDYEAGFGDWSNVGGDDIDWTRNSGGTPSSGTGPTGDHTTGSGFYMYIEASSPNYPSMTATLEGPCVDLTGSSSASLSFWYHMLGSDVGTLFVEVSNDCSTWTTAWSLFGDQGSAWQQASVDLTAWSGSIVTIRFRGVTGSSWQGDICIDDLVIDATGGPECIVPTDCDDGLFCNGAEDCVAGSCVAGTPPNCSDGVACTDDSCNETTDSCDNAPNNGNCDDGLFCNGSETCDAVLDCQSGTAPNCNDGVACTDDSCNEATDSCDNTPNNANCDNGLFCDGAETCNATLDCQAGSDPCIGFFGCDEVNDVCVECFVDGDCDDAAFCNGAETCDVNNLCQSGTPVNCNDVVGCTDDSCNEATDLCDNIANNSNCDDGLFCNGSETCDALLDCQAGTAVDCSDGVACTDDSCNEATDSCDNTPNNANCDNGLFCDGTETCDPALDCLAGSAVNCNDGVGCTDDSCNEATDACDNIANDANCLDDGLFCNGAEFCGAVNDCTSTGDPCAGGEVCNEITDTCDPGGGARMESGALSVGTFPVTVSLVNNYVSPVVVCSIQYSNNIIPVVARVTNVTSISFDVYLQGAGAGGVLAENVSYLVVEEGAWTIDGVNIEAQTYLSTVTDENNSWVGEAQIYLQSYTNPVVVGQVMSDNDVEWSVFWDQGSSRTSPPSASLLTTGKTVCEDTITTRANETIGFIVIEAGHGTLGGVEFEAALGADSVRGVTNAPPYTYTFNTAFAATPTVGIVTMAAVDGNNGGWAYTFGSAPTSTTSLDLVIDEDQIGDTERNHTPEQVAYIVFSGPAVSP